MLHLQLMKDIGLCLPLGYFNLLKPFSNNSFCSFSPRCPCNTEQSKSSTTLSNSSINLGSHI